MKMYEDYGYYVELNEEYLTSAKCFCLSLAFYISSHQDNVPNSRHPPCRLDHLEEPAIIRTG